MSANLLCKTNPLSYKQQNRLQSICARGAPRIVSSSREVVVKAGAKKLLALDFDGVICDSVNESSISAFKAACVQWPEIFESPKAQSSQKHLLELMRSARPVVETGFENVVLIRSLLEGVPLEDVLGNWSSILAERMKTWNLNRQELVTLYASIRDGWIKDDLDGWLHANGVYPHAVKALQTLIAENLADIYIVTTKQARYTDLILRKLAGISLDPERIISQTVSGRPKSEVLERLSTAHPESADAPSGRIFVEDKLSTLEKVERVSSLLDWNLVLVDWGYNTASERARTAAAAAAAPPATRIKIVGASNFSDTLLL